MMRSVSSGVYGWPTWIGLDFVMYMEYVILVRFENSASNAHGNSYPSGSYLDRIKLIEQAVRWWSVWVWEETSI